MDIPPQRYYVIFRCSTKNNKSKSFPNKCYGAMNFHYTEIMTVLLLYLVFSFLTYEVNYSKKKIYILFLRLAFKPYFAELVFEIYSFKLYFADQIFVIYGQKRKNKFCNNLFCNNLLYQKFLLLR